MGLRRSRDKFTERLLAICERAAAPGQPVEIAAIYVFGSYSRGAAECGDLDLLVYYNRVDQERCPTINISGIKFPSPDKYIRQAIVGRGLPIDVLAFQGAALRDADVDNLSSAPILVWSRGAQDVRAAVAGIEIDRDAGRHERNHVVSAKRIYDGVSGLEALNAAVAAGVVSVERVPVDRKAPPPWPESVRDRAERRAVRRAGSGEAGAPRRVVLQRFATQWLVEQGCVSIEEGWMRGASSYGYTRNGDYYLTDLGAPSLSLALDALEKPLERGRPYRAERYAARWPYHPDAFVGGGPVAVYVLPYLLTHEPNEALILRRGPPAAPSGSR